MSCKCSSRPGTHPNVSPSFREGQGFESVVNFPAFEFFCCFYSETCEYSWSFYRSVHRSKLYCGIFIGHFQLTTFLNKLVEKARNYCTELVKHILCMMRKSAIVKGFLFLPQLCFFTCVIFPPY